MSRTSPSGPVVLCIMDGVGLRDDSHGNAVKQAQTPHLDRLMAEHAWCALRAHGTAVGLPSDGDMGNSEVGHNAMGAGRIFEQGASLVEAALASGRMWQSPVWKKLTEAPTLHLMGLVSDGNVHSHVRHLNAMIARAALDGVPRLRVHILTDGRDVDPRSALTWVEPLEANLAAHRTEGRDYRVASGGGRMHITMDRYEADWDMVARGWQCHVHGEGRPFPSATQAIQTLYEEDRRVDDQWLPAFVIVDPNGEPVGRIHDGHAVLFFNFRGDRAIEISRAFTESDFSGFERGRTPKVYYAGMMQYDGDLHVPDEYLVAPPAIDRTVGEQLIAAGKRTFACSETQKFGHVTFFFNGNRSGYLDEAQERYLDIPSDNAPFEERPWMKAAEVADACIEAIQSGTFDHVRLNFANGDMVGHTGHLEAARMAVEAVDLQIGRLWEATQAVGGILIITADHGNADDMFMRNKAGDPLKNAEGTYVPRTSHTLAPVPFIVCDPRGRRELHNHDGASIAAIGTTVLELLGVPVPEDYLPGLVKG